MIAPLPIDEAERLQTLREYGILDTEASREFDDITLLASHICEAPIALISLVDENRQWFKSRIGVDESETPRDIAFCAHGILQAEVFVVNDAQQDERFADNPLVTGPARIRFYAGAPLIASDGHALGMLCVKDRVPRQLNSRQVQALEALGRQVVAQMELRRQTEESRERIEALRRTERELLWKTAFLEAQVNSTIDGILVVDENKKKILQNQRFAELLKIPCHIAEDKEDGAQLRWVTGSVKDSKGFIERVLYLYSHPGETGRDEIELRDGTVLDRYSSPVIGKDGEYYGRIWTFRDVTDRKLAEARLSEAHRELVDVSRKAGMAEIATNVLHNVGNVLNSVNVSAGCIAGILRKSKIDGVGSAAELVRKEPVAADPQGSGGRLAAYLGKLSEGLQRDRRSALDELDLLSRNIDHIKEIVAMQQNYASAGSLREKADPRKLVEDALRLNAEAFSQSRIEVACECGEIPPVLLDKHKVLQILVNLLRNARHACHDSPREDKRIAVRIAARDGRLSIAVQDNGVGIPAGNMTRIFSHGFTTKRKGHGFGLHSSALAAKEAGGSLSAWSEGPGEGAVFTLEIPIQSAEERP